MPAASQINTSHTVMRNPRTHGWPERLPGSSVMREVMPQTYHSPCNEVLLRSLTAEIKRVPRPDGVSWKPTAFAPPSGRRRCLRWKRTALPRKTAISFLPGRHGNSRKTTLFPYTKVGMGIAEIRPDVFFVGEEAFLFGARAHVQDVHFAAAAEYALEPATELGRIHGAATLGEVGQHGRIAVEAVGGNGDDVVLGTEVQVVGQADGAQDVADAGDAEQSFERRQVAWRQP